MAHPNADELTTFKRRWNESVEVCKSKVERADLRQATKIKSYDDCLANLNTTLDRGQNPRATGALLSIKSSVEHLRGLTSIFEQVMDGQCDSSMTWGWIVVILNLCDDVDFGQPPLPLFAERIKTIAVDRVPIMVEYWNHRGFSTGEVMETAFDMRTLIDEFLVGSIEEIHELQNEQMNLANTRSPSTHHDQYQRTLAKIDAVSKKVQDLAEARADQTGPITNNNTLVVAAPESPKQLQSNNPQRSRVMLPAHRNPRFFGRKRELGLIDAYLCAKDAVGLRSLAIHGLGGVGKTQTALAYAYSKADSFDVVLWLAAETELALSTSLSDGALFLKLAGAEPGQGGHNAKVMLEWLQSTASRWLLIYDNAEAGKFLNRFVPKARHGAILMTTRNVNLSRVPCSAGYEISCFENEDGASFLLHLLAAQDITRDAPDAQDQKDAEELCAQVGGHALALTQMVGLITARGWGLNECLDMYKERPKALHGLTHELEIDANYKFFINTVFRESLTGVKETHAHTLLGVLSFLVPDVIPQALFEPPKDAGEIPAGLEFCKDPIQFDEALRPLLSLALVKKESKCKDRNLSLHRLVQREFSFFVDCNDRQTLFDQAIYLLRRAFPARVAARFLHSRWPECELYIQHVIAVLDNWKTDAELPKLRAPLEFCSLLSSAAWYLHELGEYGILERFLKDAFLVFEDQHIKEGAKMDYARLRMVAGVMWDNWGHFSESIKSFMECLEISTECLGPEDEFIGGIYNDLGNVSESLGKPDQAIEWHEKAWSIRALSDDPTGENIGHCKSNMARSLLMLDRDKEAADMMDEAGRVFRDASAWFHEAHCHFCKGNYHRKRGEFEEAREKYRLSLDLLLNKVKADSHVRTSACLYKLGATHVDEGDGIAALPLLQEALQVCDQQKQNQADRARILHKMAEAAEEVDEEKRGGLMIPDPDNLRKEARKLYRQLAPKERGKDEPSEDDYDLLVCGLHR